MMGKAHSQKCAWSIEFEIPLGRGQRRAEDVTPLGLFGERELDT